MHCYDYYKHHYYLFWQEIASIDSILVRSLGNSIIPGVTQCSLPNRQNNYTGFETNMQTDNLLNMFGLRHIWTRPSEFGIRKEVNGKSLIHD